MPSYFGSKTHSGPRGSSLPTVASIGASVERPASRREAAARRTRAAALLMRCDAAYSLAVRGSGYVPE